MKSLIVRIGCVVLVAFDTACEAPKPYQVRRAATQTRLLVQSPSPQPFEEETPPEQVEVIEYKSGALSLKGWLAVPNGGHGPKPAIVHLHGGFAFSFEDYEQARPFLDAGYVVLFPMLRGENGNDGHFEMMYGEVEDVLAAVSWLSKRPEVDRTRIAVFGHSVGGAIAELTTLWPDQSIVASGSVGALYPPEAFLGWRDFAPFDVSDAGEVDLRTFVTNIAEMKRAHFAYVGAEEPQAATVDDIRQRAASLGVPLSIQVVRGDHQTSVTEAMETFLRELSRL